MRRIALPIVALAVMYCAVPSAQAATFTVNDLGDLGDANLSEPACATTGAVCTLRAAVEQANFDTTSDNIHFGLSASSTISLGSVLSVTQPVTIDGCNGSATAPCVGVRAPSTAVDTFSVTAPNVTIKGLAVTNARQGIFYGFGQTGLNVQNNWFGTKIDGTTAEGVSTGISVIGNNATIGGTTAQDRNVFSNGAGFNRVAVQVFTGDNNTIKGNYFGVTPSGLLTTNRFTIDVQVVGNTGPDAPINTVIGGTVSGAGQATNACDEACNVISGASLHGIDLFGNNSDLTPAGQTTIAGNYIGLDPNGGSSFGNALMGVFLGITPVARDVTIGGTSAGDRNFIGGNFQHGIQGGDATTAVRGNSIGIGPANIPIPDAAFGADIGGGLFTGNQLAGDGLQPLWAGLHIYGNNANVRGNTFGLASDGSARSIPLPVSVEGNGNTIGGTSPGDGNTIGFWQTSALAIIAGDSNVVQGNFVGETPLGANIGNPGPGILIRNNSLDPADGNTVGGDSAAAENLISHVGGSAVAVTGSSSDNRVLRNHGSGNGAIFIDLGADGAGNLAGGPNGGIQPPTVSVSGTSVSGTASPNATVRVFTANSALGDISSFVAQATADAVGIWSATLPSAPGPGQNVAATQTTAIGTSELAIGLIGSSGASSESSSPPKTSPRTSKSLVLISGSSLKLDRKGNVSIPLNCPGTQVCDGTLSLESAGKVKVAKKRKLKLGSKKFSIAARKKVAVKVKLSKRNAKLVRKLRSLKVKVIVTDTDAAGRARKTSKALKLKSG